MNIYQAFDKVYKNYLLECGYIRVKGKYPYYIQISGEEIIKTISCIPRPTSYYGKSGFNVVGFIYNIYYDAPNFEKAPVYHNWKMLSDLLKYSSAFGYSNEVWEKLYCFEYMKNDDDDLFLKMNESVEATRLLIVLEFEKINNLEACIKWYDKYLYQISVNPSRFIMENEPVFARYNELFFLTESVEQYHRRLDNNFIEEINRRLYDAKKRGDEEQCVKYGKIRNNFDMEEKKRYER